MGHRQQAQVAALDALAQSLPLAILAALHRALGGVNQLSLSQVESALGLSHLRMGRSLQLLPAGISATSASSPRAVY